MRTFALVFFLLIPCTVFAQVQSDPFALAHPTTGEPGVWVPPWVQKMHLETETSLKTCVETTSTQTALIAEKNAEISAYSSATLHLKDGLRHTQAQLVANEAKLRAARSSAEGRLIWALTATGIAVVTGTILTLAAVF